MLSLHSDGCPKKVLVGIDGFSVHTGGECSIVFWCDQCVQEWYKTFCPCVFYCKFHGNICVVDMLKEVFYVLWPVLENTPATMLFHVLKVSHIDIF